MYYSNSTIGIFNRNIQYHHTTANFNRTTINQIIFHSKSSLRIPVTYIGEQLQHWTSATCLLAHRQGRDASRTVKSDLEQYVSTTSPHSHYNFPFFLQSNGSESVYVICCANTRKLRLLVHFRIWLYLGTSYLSKIINFSTRHTKICNNSNILPRFIVFQNSLMYTSTWKIKILQYHKRNKKIRDTLKVLHKKKANTQKIN